MKEPVRTKTQTSPDLHRPCQTGPGEDSNYDGAAFCPEKPFISSPGQEGLSKTASHFSTMTHAKTFPPHGSKKPEFLLCAAGDFCSWSYFFKTLAQQNLLSPDSFPGLPRRTDTSPRSAGPLTSSPPPFPCSSPTISFSPTDFILPAVLPKDSQKAVWL